MRQVSASVLAVVAAVAQITSAKPTARATEEPCLQVSKQWTAGKDKDTPVSVPASLAYACLTSVPLNKQNALDLVDSIRPYLEWQSDAAYKASPPADYSFAANDIFGNLAAVRTKLTNDAYAGEYDFQKELYETVFAAGHDGHLYMYPDLLARATRFRRKHALVSVSDGSNVPAIKVFSEVTGGNASAVTQINGKPAVTFLGDYVRRYAGSQDFDAGYNSMFYQQAQFVSIKTMGDFATGGGGSLVYQGANTTLTFKNGTSLTTENFAQLRGDWSGVTDGPSFYTKFCTPIDPPKANHTVTSPAVNGVLPGYPKPVVISSDGQVSGYYLEGAGYENTAVLTLLSFEPGSLDEFQTKVAEFLSKAKEAGKTKLVLDLQANGGGFVLLGYDLFRQLFPDIVQDGYSRWKESDSFTAIAHTYSEEISAALASNQSASPATVDDYQTSFPYQADLNITNGPFQTFEDKFTPSTYKNTKYTQIMRLNLDGTGIYGYGKLAGKPQPFAAEDIVLLYDGYCASTCTLASEMLRIQGGVKSVAFGGRPVAGPMQGVGGVKGAQVLNFADIRRYTQRASQLTSDKARRKEFSRFNDLVMKRSVASGVNVRDQILRDNVNDGLPAQYVYEAADCRMYWKEGMLRDVSQIWKSAASAAFNNAQCANGGISHSSSQRSTRSDSQEASGQEDSAKPASQAAQKFDSTEAQALAGVLPISKDDFKPAPTNLDWRAKYLQKITRVD